MSKILSPQNRFTGRYQEIPKAREHSHSSFHQIKCISYFSIVQAREACLYAYVHSDNNALSMKAANWFWPRRSNANGSAKFAKGNDVISSNIYPECLRYRGINYHSRQKESRQKGTQNNIYKFCFQLHDNLTRCSLFNFRQLMYNRIIIITYNVTLPSRVQQSCLGKAIIMLILLLK